ncbi:MAG: sortase [Clostridia bacterium]
MILAVLMLVCAGVLLFYNSSENDRVEEESLETVTELENILEQQVNEQGNSQNNIQTTKETSNNDRTSINIKGHNYIGIVYIPILNNLALPVIEECTESNLKVSVCRYSGSLKENNFVVAGHNYKSSFGKLSKLVVGNIAYFKDINGNVYKYHCKAIETLSPKSVNEMVNGDWDMTLFTCTYNGANRVAYRFEL